MPGELITSFRPEVQQKILANQDLYNPDKNELIDANEIGVLLKDFNATNVKELQNSKSVMEKLNDYIFPKVDVMPAEGNGYRVVYTDGDEEYISAGRAEEIKKERFRGFGSMSGGIAMTSGAALSATLAIGGICDVLTHKFPGTGKKALVFGALTALGTFLAKKCFNSFENEVKIKSKIYDLSVKS